MSSEEMNMRSSWQSRTIYLWNHIQVNCEFSSVRNKTSSPHMPGTVQRYMCGVCRPIWIQTDTACAHYSGGGDLSIMQHEGECSRRSQWRRACVCVCVKCVYVRLCVRSTRLRRCQMEEVNDGYRVAEVSDEKGWMMERGALYEADLCEKCMWCTVEEEKEKQEEEEEETHWVGVWRSQWKRLGEVSVQ